MTTIFEKIVKVPILETPRLLLRSHARTDFESSVQMWADPLVTRFIGGKPNTPQQTWAKMLTHLGHWWMMGFGYWAIEEKSSGRHIGEMGFADLQRTMEPALDAPELGWALASDSHGKGYSTEALRCILQWADSNQPWTKTVCIIDPENRPSLRVAEKIGYKEIYRTQYQEKPVVVLSRQVSLSS